MELNNKGAFRTIFKAQIKHIREFQHKEYWAPYDPPPGNSLCLGFFLYFEGKGGPKHKEFTGSGVLRGGGGGLGGGFPAKFFMVTLDFLVLRN